MESVVGGLLEGIDKPITVLYVGHRDPAAIIAA
jgi:hypothetical protein